MPGSVAGRLQRKHPPRFEIVTGAGSEVSSGTTLGGPAALEHVHVRFGFGFVVDAGQAEPEEL